MAEFDELNSKKIIDPTALYSLEQASMMSMIRPNDIMLMYSFVNEYTGRIPDYIRDDATGKLFFTGDNVMLLQPCFEGFSKWLELNYDEHGRRRYIEEDIDDDFLDRESIEYSEQDDTTENTSSHDNNEDDPSFFDDNEEGDVEDNEKKKPKKKKKFKNPDEAIRSYYASIEKANEEIRRNQERLKSEEFKKLEETKKHEEELRINQNIKKYNHEIQLAQASIISNYVAVNYTEGDKTFVENVSTEYIKLEEEKHKIQESLKRNNEEIERLRAEYGLKEIEKQKIYEEETLKSQNDVKSFVTGDIDTNSNASFKYDSEKHRGFDFSFHGNYYNADEYFQKQEELNNTLEQDSMNRLIIERQQQDKESFNDFSDKYKNLIEDSKAKLEALDNVEKKEAGITSTYMEYIAESTIRDSKMDIDTNYYKAQLDNINLENSSKYNTERVQYIEQLKHQEDQFIIAEAYHKIDEVKEKLKSEYEIKPQGLDELSLSTRRENILNRYTSEINTIIADTQTLLTNDESRIIKQDDYYSVKESFLATSKNTSIDLVSIEEREKIANLKNVYNPSSDEYKNAIMEIHADADQKRSDFNLAYVEGLHNVRAEQYSTSAFFQQMASVEIQSALNSVDNVSDKTKANILLNTADIWQEKALDEAKRNLSLNMVEVNKYCKEIENNSKISDHEVKSLLRSSFLMNAQQEIYKNHEERVKSILLTSYANKEAVINNLKTDIQEKSQLVSELKQKTAYLTTEISLKRLEIERLTELKLTENDAKLQVIVNSDGKVRDLNITEKNRLNIRNNEINAKYDAAIVSTKELIKNQVFPLGKQDNSIISSGKNLKLDDVSTDDKNGTAIAEANSKLFYKGRKLERVDMLATQIGARAARQFGMLATQSISGTDLGTGVHELKDVMAIASLPLTLMAAVNMRQYASELKSLGDMTKFEVLRDPLTAMREDRINAKLNAQKLTRKDKDGIKLVDRMTKKDVFADGHMASDLRRYIRLNYKNKKGQPLDLRKYTMGQLKKLLNDHDEKLAAAAFFEFNNRKRKMAGSARGKVASKINRTTNAMNNIFLGGTDFDSGFRTTEKITRITSRALGQIYRSARGLGTRIYNTEAMQMFVGNTKRAASAARESARDLTKKGAQKFSQTKPGQKINKINNSAKGAAKKGATRIRNSKPAQKINNLRKRTQKIGGRINTLRKRTQKIGRKIADSKPIKGISKVLKFNKKISSAIGKSLAKIFNVFNKIKFYAAAILAVLVITIVIFVGVANSIYGLMSDPSQSWLRNILNAFEKESYIEHSYYYFYVKGDGGPLDVDIDWDNFLPSISMGRPANVETLWYEKLYDSTTNASLSPSAVANYNGDVNGWKSYEGLSEQYKKGENPSLVNSVINNYGGNGVNSTEVKFYNFDRNRVFPSEDNEALSNKARNDRFAALSGISNVKTVIAIADIKMQYGKLNETNPPSLPAGADKVISNTADDAALDWPRWKFNRYCTRVFNASHHASFFISNLKNCTNEDCKEATWYCNTTLPPDSGHIGVIDTNPGQEYINRLTQKIQTNPSDKSPFIDNKISHNGYSDYGYKCIGPNEYPLGWYYCDTNTMAIMRNAKNHNFTREVYDAAGNYLGQSTIFGDGSSGCRTVRCVDGKDRKCCPGHPFKNNSIVFDTLKYKMKHSSSESVVEYLKTVNPATDFVGYYDLSNASILQNDLGSSYKGKIEYNVTETFTRSDYNDIKASFYKYGLLDKNTNNIVIDFENETGLMPKTTNTDAKKAYADARDNGYSIYNAMLEACKKKDGTGDDIFYNEDKCLYIFSIKNNKYYLDIFVDIDFPTYHKLSNGDDELCKGKILEEITDYSTTSEFTTAINITREMRVKNFLGIVTRRYNRVETLNNVHVTVSYANRCKDCTFEYPQKETLNVGYYTYCCGHTMKYCTGHVTLLANGYIGYVDDEVNSPIIENTPDKVYKSGAVYKVYNDSLPSYCLWRKLMTEDSGAPHEVEPAYGTANQIDWLIYSPDNQELSYPMFVYEHAQKGKTWGNFYSSSGSNFFMPNLQYVVRLDQKDCGLTKNGLYTNPINSKQCQGLYVYADVDLPLIPFID